MDAFEAVERGDLPTLSRMMYHGTGLLQQTRDDFGESLLHVACSHALPRIVEFLIEVRQRFSAVNNIKQPAIAISKDLFYVRSL